MVIVNVLHRENSPATNHPRAHTVKMGKITTRKNLPQPPAILLNRAYHAYQATQTPLFSNPLMLPFDTQVCHECPIRLRFHWILQVILEKAFSAHCTRIWKLNRISMTIISKVAACDTVEHDRLLAVLNSRIGIAGAALSWFESNWKGCTQHIVIKNVQSSMTKLKCGVPQGSVLGPVLFTTYLIPLGDILRKFGVQFHCYADDTQLYIPFSQNDNSCLGSVEECISEIQFWMKANFIKLNAEKNEMIILSSPFFAKARTHDMIVNFNGELIHPNKAVRNLGVIFDNTMNTESRVNKIYTLEEYYNPEDACESLVLAFITSRLDSVNAVLYGLPKYLIEKLQRVQNFSARLSTGSYKCDHITAVLKSLHWLPVEQKIRYKIAVLGFKRVYGSAPSYLQNLVELYTPRRTLRNSSDKLTLSIPKVRTLYGERSFRYHWAVEWNTLPYDIRSCESLDSFKAKLKTYLFSSAYH